MPYDLFEVVVERQHFRRDPDGYITEFEEWTDILRVIARSRGQARSLVVGHCDLDYTYPMSIRKRLAGVGDDALPHVIDRDIITDETPEWWEY